MNLNRRTVRDFPYHGDLWSIVESWAAQARFVEREREPNRRLYKGGGLLMPSVFLEIRQEGDDVTLEAWVKADFLLIVSLLAGKKPEMAINPGGLTAAIPRRKAREAINPLLKRLNQPPIS